MHVALLLSVCLAASVNESLFSKDDVDDHIRGCIQVYSSLENRVSYVPKESHLSESVATSTCYFWCPTNSDKKLFQDVDIFHDVVPSMFSGSVYFRSFFLVAIIAQYLLPAWYGSASLSDNEKTVIRELAPYVTSRLRPYLSCIVWSLFFGAGCSFNPKKSPNLKRMKLFLTSLGFNIQNIVPISWDCRAFQRKAKDLDHLKVLRVAKQWGLSVQEVARNMPKNTFADAFLENPTLIPDTPVSIRSVIVAMSDFGDAPARIRVLKRKATQTDDEPEPKRIRQ